MLDRRVSKPSIQHEFGNFDITVSGLPVTGGESAVMPPADQGSHFESEPPFDLYKL